MDLLTDCVTVTGVKQLTALVVPAVFRWAFVGARQWTLIGKGHIILIGVQMIGHTIANANLCDCLPVDLFARNGLIFITIICTHWRNFNWTIKEISRK